RRERAAEHVVDALVLVRALHRDHVARLLHHADHAVVAARVLADSAARLVGQVEGGLAQADSLLDFADRVGQRERVLARGAQDVKGQALGRAVADARQLRELADQALHGRCVGGAHGIGPGSALLARYRPGRPRPPRLPRSSPPEAPPSFFAARSWAMRSPSLTAASTMSERISRSSGSTASG